MSEPKDIFLGFDPGGRGTEKGETRKGRFGWSICKIQAGGGEIKVIDTGLARDANEVVTAVIESLCCNNLQRDRVQAAGIDAPLIWTETGIREVDGIIQKAVKGYNYRIQTINQLRGACLVQGVLLADQLYRKFKLPITEVHPGALSCLLDISTLCCISSLTLEMTEHEADATLSAYAAWRMWENDPKWRNLFEFEKEAGPILCPLETPVSYWMPIP